MAAHDSPESLYRVLFDRCQSLEASHARLRAELHELRRHRRKKKEKREEDDVVLTSDYSGSSFHLPGFFLSGSPYKAVLDSMGHAVHVCTASSGEINYWNRSAENLYGWKDHEVLGQRVAELLVAEDYHALLKRILERLRLGLSWSGQFPFKKRSGEIFMAMVTKSPLYEDGELVGIITVSTDAALCNRIESDLRAFKDRANAQHRGWQLKYPRPPLVPVPQIASSVSNLASKLLSRNGDDVCNSSVMDKVREDSTTDTEDANLEKPGTLAAKFLAKLQIIGTNKGGKQEDPNSPRKSKASSSCHCFVDTDSKEERPNKINSSLEDKRTHSNVFCQKNPIPSGENSVLASSRECNECFRLSRPGYPKPEEHNLNALEIQDAVHEQNGRQLPGSVESIDNHGSCSSKGVNDSNPREDYEIRWDDLHLGEAIGQGSCAIVYRGIWNGSDVAIKVYFKNEYSEGILHDYKKEIDIMKRLRHPNVLLFMGAICSQERLAIVTEYLPRGSLFKQLHKNNQTLDIRRRLMMALDVARGMNYLHHRNPPIVHRDLKSSNLLVDKNWTVKVGDFDLSKLKNATFLTAKSGRGTPQWMAPEILRNEPSNEKSDVFSFGVILWELMTESIPWNNLNSLQVVGVVGFMDRRLDIPEGLDPEVVLVIEDCWRSDPEQRPSFEDIIQRMKGLVHRVAAPCVRRSSEA
ncbi:hypothetical protein Pyn_17966 [Prunus yedoensis var. nudiflora]|uniref:non-specific serine/threonine protein kinase n=1 Tax=Prunus yedoensis var. nudiflora TaxID=2094558 RepID=A0A314ZPZ2_PRUYE|nr:hypothetical protein Pyn_17966 [Prunus yedoensis var. nudiflora]